MKLNNIYLCFVLWITVGGLASICSIYRRIRAKKKNKLRLAYMNRLMLLAEQNHDVTTLLREVYYGFNNKLFKHCLFKALLLQEKAKDKEAYAQIGFRYIEKKYGCKPMNLIHNYLINEFLKNGKLSTMDYAAFYNYGEKLINAWKKEELVFNRIMRKELIKGVLWQLFFFNMNIAVYFNFYTEISELILVIVNTIGIVVFIILDYERTFVDVKNRDGKLAKTFWGKKRALAKTIRIKSFYQLIGGMGLIINLGLFVSQKLAQEALF